MTRLNFPKGVHQYEIQGNILFAEYMGRQQGFECCVCGKGRNAFTFNVLHGNTYAEAFNNYKNGDYETWGFGREHIEQAVRLVNYFYIGYSE